MKEVKTGSETKKTVDAFFDDENRFENKALQNFVNRAALSKLEDEKSYAAEDKPWVSYLKQAFLFLPGTFLLFFISLGTALAVTSPFEKNVFFSKLFLPIYFIGFLGIFMTWFGFGDLKNKKHFAIPASIIISGAMIGAFVRAAENIFWIAAKIIDDFGYAVYLFPIGLIVPVLVKDWVDKKSGKE